ncbi:transposase [Aphanothece hegewaldii CCALA 016]|uniref:Transposase n=1 Tax=Aphanothece hegewaldii CCALA 016 TaxID=2107694 RepID=A0A2T1LZ22_9CHRO|nr:transposase [Aphanothece hegewaldii]PSF37586.1 transposase [Aphanothece hegewaldii CCALA 016]
MTKSADIGSKRLISLSPKQWLQWVTQIPNIQPREIISSDFQWISRESDVLIHAYSPNDGEFLVLNEMQLHYTPQMPRRMFAYAGLATEKYQLPVYPVLVNILPPSKKTVVMSSYQTTFRGLRSIQDYHVINLWEVDAEIVFRESITSLLPFVPILKNGGQATTVRTALQQLRRDETLNELEPLLAFFATFVLSSELVRQIMRWDMAVLRESPWYNEILEEGIEIGIQRSIQQNIRQEVLSGIELGLDLKFGDVGLQLMPEIREIQDVETLKRVRESLRTVQTLDELRQVYQNP